MPGVPFTAGTKVTLPDGSKVSGGGVRAACTDCHRYHRDLPIQGRVRQPGIPKEPRPAQAGSKGSTEVAMQDAAVL